MITIFEEDFFEPDIEFGKSAADLDQPQKSRFFRVRNATAALAATTLLTMSATATELAVQPEALADGTASFEGSGLSERDDGCRKQILELAEIPIGAKNRASRWLRSVRQDLESRGAAWVEPHVTASPESEVVFEWWHRERKLTSYFSETGALSLRVWGPNIDTEMEESDPEDEEKFIEAWRWLRR